MNIQLVEVTISIDDLKEIAKEFYDPMIKGAVDIEKGTAAFGGEYHIDACNLLVETGSEQKDVWGFNILLDQPHDSWIEFTSLINIRPQIGNRDMEVADPGVRDKMRSILDKMIV